MFSSGTSIEKFLKVSRICFVSSNFLNKIAYYQINPFIYFSTDVQDRSPLRRGPHDRLGLRHLHGLSGAARQIRPPRKIF